jgi:hypothetical protein
LRIPVVESSAHPVIRVLSSALATVDSVDSRHAEINADAMRLAIFARLPCLRSEVQQSTRRDGGEGAVERRIGSLQKWRFNADGGISHLVS